LTKVDPDVIRSYVPYDHYDCLAAEIAFHADEPAEMQEHLKNIADQTANRYHTAGLVLRWSDQLSRGESLTYREDVDKWLACCSEAARSNRAVSTQAILYLEGRTDADWMQQATSGLHPDTVELVRCFKLHAEGEDLNLSCLSEIANSENVRDFAPRLARTILARRQPLG
jgi:hypothetical protein